MASTTVAVDLAASPGLLWPLMIDFDRHHEWLAGHDRFVTEPPEDTVPGAVFVQRGTFKGVSGWVEWLIEDLRPDRLLHLSGRAPRGLRVGARIILAPEGAGTKVTCEYELRGTRLAAPILRAGRRTVYRNTRTSLTRLDVLTRSGLAPIPRTA